MATRQQIVSQAVKASKPRTATGGITAPKSKGGSTGLNAGRAVPRPVKGATKPLGTPTAPAAPAPANYTPTPWDSRYEQTVAGAQKKYLNAGANFDLAEQTAKQDFGLDPGFNDYKSNPNSRAALLEETFRRNNRGTMSGAGLQLYSGSTSNRLASNRRSYGLDRDQLTRQYQEALGEITAGRAEAAERKAEEENNAYWDRIGAAEQAPLDAEAAPAGQTKQPKKKTRQQQTKVAVANARKAPAGKRKK